jgi:hypothetical protein
MLRLLSLLPRFQSYKCSSVAMLTLICQECFSLRTFLVLFILVSCNTSLIRPLNCTNRNVPHLFLAIGRMQSVYSRQWLVTISECTFLDLSVTRLPCSFAESSKSLIYLILCLLLDFLSKWRGGVGGEETGCITILESTDLNFKNRASYIYRTGAPLPSKCCILYIFSTNISTEYFKHATHSPFFSSKCRLFHNSIFFYFCIIQILHTECAKI